MRLRFAFLALCAACQPVTLAIETPELRSEHIVAAIVDADDRLAEVLGPYARGEVLIERELDLSSQLYLLGTSDEALHDAVPYPIGQTPLRARTRPTGSSCASRFLTDEREVELPLPVEEAFKLEDDRFEVADGRPLGERIAVSVELRTCDTVPGIGPIREVGRIALSEAERIFGLTLTSAGAEVLVTTRDRAIVLGPGEAREYNAAAEGFFIGGFDPTTFRVAIHRGSEGQVAELTVTATSVAPGPILLETESPMGAIVPMPGDGFAYVEWPRTIVLVDGAGAQRRHEANTIGEISRLFYGPPLWAGTTEGEILELQSGELLVHQTYLFDTPYGSAISDLFQVKDIPWANTAQGRLFEPDDDRVNWHTFELPLSTDAGECVQAPDGCGTPGTIGNNLTISHRADPPLVFITSEGCRRSFVHGPRQGCTRTVTLELNGETLVPERSAIVGETLLFSVGGAIYRAPLID